MSEMVDDDGKPLVAGAFYWVMPTYDVDLQLTAEELGEAEPDSDDAYLKCFEHWTQQSQPARFAGVSAEGREMWNYLSLEGDGPHGASDWPTRWIGSRIEKP